MKVNLSLCLIKLHPVLENHATKTYGEMDVWLHTFFILTLDRVNGQFHAPVALPPGKQPPPVPSGLGGSSGPRAVLDGKKKFLPLPGIEPRSFNM
jgi:hypothetical protein